MLAPLCLWKGTRLPFYDQIPVSFLSARRRSLLKERYGIGCLICGLEGCLLQAAAASGRYPEGFQPTTPFDPTVTESDWFLHKAWRWILFRLFGLRCHIPADQLSVCAVQKKAPSAWADAPFCASGQRRYIILLPPLFLHPSFFNDMIQSSASCLTFWI
jgi:hypothetical protein